MEFGELVSRPIFDQVRDPFLQVSVSKVSGLVLVFKGYRTGFGH